MANTKTTPSQPKSTKRDYIFAVGRRREAVARVRLYQAVRDGLAWDTNTINKGDIWVNKKPISQYFAGEVNRHVYTEPMRVVNAQNKYTYTIQVDGGGPAGQLDAVVLGIARALDKVDTENNHKVLKDKGFLTRDARVRERRKVGMGGKSRRKLQSPKR